MKETNATRIQIAFFDGANDAPKWDLWGGGLHMYFLNYYKVHCFRLDRQYPAI